MLPIVAGPDAPTIHMTLVALQGVVPEVQPLYSPRAGVRLISGATLAAAFGYPVIFVARLVSNRPQAECREQGTSFRRKACFSSSLRSGRWRATWRIWPSCCRSLLVPIGAIPSLCRRQQEKAPPSISTIFESPFIRTMASRRRRKTRCGS